MSRMAMTVIGLGLFTASADCTKMENNVGLYTELRTNITERVGEFERIPADRKERLEGLARYVADRWRSHQSASVIFVCTHNSRRSQLAQLWAQVAANHYGIQGFQTYSGGTEATAFNPRAVDAARRAGFRIEKTTDDETPIYHVRFAENVPPQTCFSKVHDQAPNPRSAFCVVMVCSDADRACPNVRGAAARVALPYEDPKQADGTPEEAKVYDERCRQIAREMLYVFSRVAAADGK